MSVFRPEIAEALNISLKKKSSARLGTASGGVDIRTASVQWQVEDTRFQSQIGFSEKFIASFNIIGRQGFFHHFSICFNEMMKTVVMMPLKGLR